jgi:homogentisate 1,2-dioxygenase
MAHYRRVGEVPRKRHMQFRSPAGDLYAEELMGEEGFSSESSLLYHRRPPTALVKLEVVEADPPHAGAKRNLPLSPRHLRTHLLPAGGDPVEGRRPLLVNENVAVSYVAADRESGLYRNASGDELVFVESGAARCETVFGTLDVAAGDYLLLPTSTTHRYVPLEAPLRLLVIEARGHIEPPGRYLSARGQFLENAPYCERDLRSPTEPVLAEGEDTPVLVRHRGGTSLLTYAHHPFDVVGWDGCAYPYALSIHDFEPIVKRFHAPPPVHQTFEGPGFVVCSFCPRPLDFDPEAVPVPYNHANVDSDEVLFYVAGDFTSRRGAGIAAGSVTLHPAGFVHGPQPGAVEASLGAARTDELAVMVDTFRPLDLGEAAGACEDPDYPFSWARGK